MSENSTHQGAARIVSRKYIANSEYTPQDFAVPGETTQFNGIRVIDISGSGESEEFAGFTSLKHSDWTINWSSAARLKNGIILYGGRQ